MKNLRNLIFACICLAGLQACGGSGGSESQPVLEVSPGGIWQASNGFGAILPSDALDDLVFSPISIEGPVDFSDSERLIVADSGFNAFASDLSFYETTFYIDESGELWIRNTDSTGFEYGYGQITMSSTAGVIEGRYDVVRLELPVIPPGSDFTGVIAASFVEGSCAFEGTLIDEASLSLMTACDYENGAEISTALNLLPAASCLAPISCSDTSDLYSQPSSLENISGTYEAIIVSYSIPGGETTITQQINVDSTGVISGSIYVGFECDIEGAVSIINPEFNLYDIEFEYTACDESFLNGRDYEGIATIATIGANRALQILALVDGDLNTSELTFDQFFVETID